MWEISGNKICGIFLVPQNIVVDLNDVMGVCERDSIINHNIAYNVRVGKLVCGSIFFIMRLRTL